MNKQTLLNYSLFFGVLLGCLLVGEIFFRIRHLLVRGVPFFGTLAQYQETEFGWAGKKVFGDVQTSRKKVLIVGDSFTEGMGVAEDALYYHQLGKLLDAEMFVYAGRGYGTLQELLVIKRFIGAVHPDLVLLQVCSNDFLNNSFQLESESYYQNALMMRPYLINDKIEYRFPSRFGMIQMRLSMHSRLFHVIFTKLFSVEAWLARHGVLRSVEDEIVETKGNSPPFREAVQVTDAIIGKMKEPVQSTPIIAFLADDSPPYTDELRAIFHRHHISLITAVPLILNQHAAAGEAVRLEDGVHWNERGHALVAEVLGKEMKQVHF